MSKDFDIFGHTVPSGGLGPGAIGGGGGVAGRGRCRTDTVGAETGEEEEGGYIARVRQGWSFEGAIVVKMDAKEFGGDRVGFGVIEERESGDEKIKVRAKVVFDSEVIYHQCKGDVTCHERRDGRDRELRFGKNRGRKDAEKEVGFAGRVGLDDGVKMEVGKDRVRESSRGPQALFPLSISHS
jgi:hypothetical protein